MTAAAGRSSITSVTAQNSAGTAARLMFEDLERLERIRALVAAKHPTAATARLLLFSAAGFDRRLTALGAARDDVELVDLDRLYTGE